ncbi:unnamed protein product [Calicophoron daubneyi]|uniref:Proteasome assembly chaperone 4 n=1 Tax=Calicophoron daubneyi TaxID=300641 RepID=A0AAV2SXJ1_CALDB
MTQLPAGDNSPSGSSPFRWQDVVVDIPNFKTKVKLFLLKLNGGLFIWIGNDEGKFSGLSLCVPSHLGDHSSHSSRLYANGQVPINGSLGLNEQGLSRKLSGRFNCPVFLSLSLPPELEAMWDSVDPCSRKTLSEEVESALFAHLRGFLDSCVDGYG